MSFGLGGREAGMDNDIVRVKIDHNTVYGYRRWGEYAPNSRWLLMRQGIWEEIKLWVEIIGGDNK